MLICGRITQRHTARCCFKLHEKRVVTPLQRRERSAWWRPSGQRSTVAGNVTHIAMISACVGVWAGSGRPGEGHKNIYTYETISAATHVVFEAIEYMSNLCPYNHFFYIDSSLSGVETKLQGVLSRHSVLQVLCICQLAEGQGYTTIKNSSAKTYTKK